MFNLYFYFLQLKTNPLVALKLIGFYGLSSALGLYFIRLGIIYNLDYIVHYSEQAYSFVESTLNSNSHDVSSNSDESKDSKDSLESLDSVTEVKSFISSEVCLIKIESERLYDLNRSLYNEWIQSRQEVALIESSLKKASIKLANYENDVTCLSKVDLIQSKIDYLNSQLNKARSTCNCLESASRLISKKLDDLNLQLNFLYSKIDH
jgi:hypothetical protein